MTWWHRNVARNHYSVQGWRREKVYPDFIFAMSRDESDKRIVVLEMKGRHLAGNDDTEYKKTLLRMMSEAFVEDKVAHIGELDLVGMNGTRMECDLVLIPEWKTKLPELMK